MKNLTFLAASLALICATALAQPGPGPVPSSGTVNVGSAGQFTQYPASTNAVSGSSLLSYTGTAITVAHALTVTDAFTASTSFRLNGSSVVTSLLGNGTVIPTTNLAGTFTDGHLVSFQSSSGKFVDSGIPASTSVSTLSFGTTGLTPNSATSGAITVAGTLIVANGGSGAATLTGVLKGNGTSPFTAATAGTDFVAPGTVTNFTAKQTFTGTSSNISTALVNAAEPATIAATAATGTINFDVCTQSVIYFTTNASGNWTDNFRCSSGTTLNAAMVTGDVVTLTRMVTQGGSPFYNSAVTVDGSGVTPKWQGGTAPSAGNASGVDIYTYAIVKTGNAAFTIFASQTQFK